MKNKTQSLTEKQLIELDELRAAMRRIRSLVPDEVWDSRPDSNAETYELVEILAARYDFARARIRLLEREKQQLKFERSRLIGKFKP